MEHTGYSPPETAENTATTSSGSMTAPQPPTKQIALAPAAGNHTSDARPSIKCAVAAPARTDVERSRKEYPASSNLENQVPDDVVMGEILDRVSEAGSITDSVATSTRLLAAAELLRRRKELKQLEVQEAEIEVEMAEARSSRGSQRSSERRRNPREPPLPLSSLPSPETPQSKMKRFAASQVGLAPPQMPTVPELPGADGQPRVEMNQFVQNNTHNEIIIDNSVNVVQEATFAVAQMQFQTSVHQHHVEHFAEARIAETVNAAAAHCENVANQANAQCNNANAVAMDMQQQVQYAMTAITELQSDRDRLNQMLEDSNATRQAECAKAYEDGEAAGASRPVRSLQTTAGLTTPQEYSIASPPISHHSAEHGPTLMAMIAGEIRTAMSQAFATRSAELPSAKAEVASVAGSPPAAAGGTNRPGVSPAAAGGPARPADLDTFSIHESGGNVRPKTMPKARSCSPAYKFPPPLYAVPNLVPGDLGNDDVKLFSRGARKHAGTRTVTETRLHPTTSRTGAESSRGRSRKREDEPPEEPPPPPKKETPPEKSGSGKKRDGPGDGGDGGGGDDGDDSSSDSGSSFGSAGSAFSTRSATKLLKKIARKDRGKEAAEIKVPVLPSANQFRAWKHTVYTNVNAASGRDDDKVLAFIRACEKDDAKVEDFRNCPKVLTTLDRKLASALSRTATGELGRLLMQASEDALNENRSVRGRELLFIIMNYYSTGRTAEALFSINDLQIIKAKGDQLENFHNTWQNGLKGAAEKTR